MTFQKAQNMYCIGIGGIGVSAIARYAQLLGKHVSGSDISESMITRMLTQEGLYIDIGPQKTESIREDCDLVVYSSAVPFDNPQRVEAARRGITRMSYPAVLGEIAQSHTNIAIAGMHGKSTTTAMLGLVAQAAELDPLVIVGTLVPQFSPPLLYKEGVGGGKQRGSNLLAGKGDLFIVEACEFSGHFQTLAPDYLIITNIDADHLDYFKTQENIDAAFLAFALKCKKKIIACGDDVRCRRVLKDLPNVIWYGVEEGGVETGLTPSLQIPGDHNVLNALGVVAMARELEIDDKITKKALESFVGTWRRFELVGYYTSPQPSPCKGEGGGIPSPCKGEGRSALSKVHPMVGEVTGGGCSIPVISDYAHHPIEIMATIQAAREKYPDKKIFIVFQPHQRNRTQQLKDDFIKSLSLADTLIICEIYDVAGREHGEDISSQYIVDGLKAQNKDAHYAKNFQQAEQMIREFASPDDVLLIMGAGDIDILAREIIT